MSIADKSFNSFASEYDFMFRLFLFKTSRPWLRHLASDCFLSEQRFKEVYSYCFPGCLFISNCRKNSLYRLYRGIPYVNAIFPNLRGWSTNGSPALLTPFF